MVLLIHIPEPLQFAPFDFAPSKYSSSTVTCVLGTVKHSEAVKHELGLDNPEEFALHCRGCGAGSGSSHSLQDFVVLPVLVYRTGEDWISWVP